MNGTIFRSVIRRPVGIRPSLNGTSQSIEIVNAGEPTRKTESELLARIRTGEFNFVLSHTFTHSTEIDLEEGQRRPVPLTPRHRPASTLHGTEKRMRIGFEVYYTGRQQLDDDPFRKEGSPYWVIGLLVERRIGPFAYF